LELILKDPDNSVYTVKTPEELELILNHFTSSKTTTRVINIVNSKIDESKTYNVMKDENWNEFILIYFIHQSIPVKCEKYREWITWFAYYINKDGTVDVWFFKDGIIQTAELGLNIKFKKGKKTKYNNKPRIWQESNKLFRTKRW